MPNKRIYTADEIENMRTIIWLLYLTEELDKDMSNYQRKNLTEKMLQTYMSQGVGYDELSAKYQAEIGEEDKKKEKDGTDTV